MKAGVFNLLEFNYTSKQDVGEIV